MARKRGDTRFRVAAAILLIAMIAGVYGWWFINHWTPDRAEFPMQGIEISAEDGAVNWSALKVVGADFAYIGASASVFARDPAFDRNLREAREAGIRVGAVHRYDPCQPADRQAGNFVVVVPRDEAMLPPAVELDRTADDCPIKMRDAEVESELMTFLNQIETHSGKPTVLKISQDFEERYELAPRFDRQLWLTRELFQPDYAGRPWALWTANSSLANDQVEGGLRWVVVQP